MNRAYDRKRAQELVPLLESITREIAERLSELGELQALMAQHDDDAEVTPEFLDLKARFAAHKRAIRLARAELERLGCRVDENHPWRVRIPGDGGGFEWGLDHPQLRSMSSETAV